MPEHVHPPLKRHPALQPFSRDHYLALVRAQHLITSADGSADERRKSMAEFVATWTSDIRPHLDDEERLLLPLAPPDLAAELRRQHDSLRELALAATRTAEPTPDFTRALGQSFNDHIRWEERELFPQIEQTAAPERLLELLPATTAMESTRERSTCPTRKPCC